MKQLVFSKFILVLLVFGSSPSAFPFQEMNDSLSSSGLTPVERAKQVMQNNEFQRSRKGQDLVIHCNPLRVDGHSLDYREFSIHSRGVLTVVVGDPDTEGARSIPFQVYLRRSGKVVADFASGFTGEARMEVDLGWVLARSQPGDQLIINPLKEEHWKAKRILKILE